MDYKKLLFPAVLFLAACTADPAEEPSQGNTIPDPVERKIVNSADNAAQGTLLVYFDENVVEQVENAVASASRTRSAVTRSGLVSVDEVLTDLGVTSLRRLFPYNAANDARARAHCLHRWYVVGFDTEADLEGAARKLAAVSEVENVQFNTKLQRNTADLHSRPLRAGAAAAAVAGSFNDPNLSRQWHYINTGDKGVASTARSGADVNVKEAWKLTGGDPRIIVAIVDEGVKYTHPDLAANMWVNTAEKNGGSGLDDDGNGYEDDIYGYNFATRSGTLTWSVEHYDDKGKYDGDVGHGTHVAGTVAAVNNNGVGVCGVAGGTGAGDGVRLMSCQIFSGGDGGTLGVTAEAIYYAANNGASILQCSWGFEAGDVRSDDAYASGAKSEKQAIDYFISAQNCDALDGGLVIFAAGNDAKPMSGYPGAYRDYISVTSIGPDYLPAYYTNYGPGCNIAAPGGDYKISPDQQSSQVLSTVPSENIDFTGADYGYMQGTSMACPHVSGVAALGLSYALRKGKKFTVDEFKAMLLTAVNDLETYLDGTKTGMKLLDYRGQMGTGSTDAYQLLMQVEGTPCLKAKIGSRQFLALTKYFGGSAANLTYTKVEMAKEEMDKLGISEAPSIEYGKLRIHCTKPGVAKISVTAIAGGESAGSGSSMGGQEVTKQFAIIARATNNAGWL